jgi:hypothetical protein
MGALLIEIFRQAQALSPTDKIDLAIALLEQARASITRGPAQAKWADIRGSMPYPMFGDDAQAAINRMRDEWNEHEAILRSKARP